MSWKKWIIILCSVVLATVLFWSPIKIVAESKSEEVSFKSIEYHYESSVCGEQTSRFTYSDSYFLMDANECSGNIAKMCVALSSASYNRDYLNEFLIDDAHGMGFSIVNDQEKLYQDSKKWDLNDCDHVAYTIARKNIGDKTVYLVPVKGTSANAEWYSDFRLGNREDGFHEGFYKAAFNDGLYSELKAIIKQEKDPSNVVVLLTGHSRGAAVANLVAGKLSDGSLGIPRSQIFAYTFACPAVGTKVNSSLDNIYNYNNPGDLITLLPLELWGYKRYGHDISVYHSKRLEKNVYDQFARISGEECNSSHSPSEYINLISTAIKDKATYNSAKYQLIFRLIAMNLSGRTSISELWDVFDYDHFYGAVCLGLSIVKLQLDIKSGAILGNIRRLIDRYLQGTVVNYTNLAVFIDEHSSQLYEMNDESWQQFYTDNYYVIEEISQYTEMTINAPSDLLLCKSKLYNLRDLIESAISSVGQLASVFFDEQGILNGSIRDGHDPLMYVVTVNARHLGYKGWYGYSDSGVSTCYNDSNVLRIGNSTFKGVDGPFQIGEFCLSIDDYCFAKSSLAEQIELSDSLLLIRGYAFYLCANLFGEISIPAGITSIAANTFNGCEGLNKITIPENVKTIESGAFKDCSQVTELILPCDTQIVCDQTPYSFSGCYAINHVTITGSGEIPDYTSNSYPPWRIAHNGVTVVFSDEITRIGDYAFYYGNVNGTLKLPSALNGIGKNAFYGCTGLKGSINLPDNLETIGNFAFYDCERLTGELVLPSRLKTIGGYAFKYCIGLTGELVIPAEITNIEAYTFEGCEGFTKITIPESVKTIGSGAFKDCSQVTELILPCDTQIVCDQTPYSFSGCYAINHVTITGSGEIPDYTSNSYPPWRIAHSGVTVVFSDEITRIGDYAFYYGNVHGTLKLPSALNEIGKNAFYGCTGLKKLVFHNGFSALSQKTFGNSTFSDTYFIGSEEEWETLNIPDTSSFGTIHFFENKSLEGNIEENKILLTWDTVEYSDGYNLYFSIDYGPKNLIAKLQGNSYEYVANTKGEHEYTFYIGPTYNQYEGKCIDATYTIEYYPIIDIPGATTNLKAVPAGKNKVKLTWSAVNGAEGYLVYAQKDKKYAYVGMTTKGTTFTDKNALDTDYNFYWVFAYVKDENGKMIPGGCSKYVYAKGVTTAVTNLKANGTTGKVTISWSASSGADGYLVYGIRPGGKYGYIGMTTKGTTFTDAKADKSDWTFYWVFPYHKNGDKMIVGGTANYVYSKAR